MADRIFISELAQAESVNDDLMFVSDDGTQTNKVKASQIADYVKDNLGDVGSVKSVNEVLPDENGNITLTAEDIGITPGTGGGGSENIKSFSSYTQLGLADDDFVGDNFETNAIKIFEAMPDYSELMVKAFSSPLSKSIIAKINADNNGTVSSTVSSTLIVEKTTQDFSGNFRVILNSRSLSYEYFCMLHYNSTDGYLITKFSSVYRPEGFVKKSGDTITGNLQIQKSTPELIMKHVGTNQYINMFIGSENIIYFRNCKDTSNRMGFYLQPETASDFNKVFRLQKTVDGTSTYYTVFGEHNKPLGTYYGSGESTSRTVSIGGIGNVLVISSENGMAWVTEGGAMVKSATSTSMTSLNASTAKFVDGVLTLKTTSAYVNGDSVEYSYQVI